MRETTLTDILADLGPMNAEKNTNSSGRSSITIWLPPEAKSRYDKLQEKSGRRFSKKVRQALLALIEMAEARSS